jgi:hypothetical protein
MRPLWVLPLVWGFALSAGPAREFAGQVVDSRTGVPVVHARVTVQIFNPGGQPVEATLLTDAVGAFSLSNVPEGAYHVFGEKAGYLRSDQPGTVQQPGRVVLQLTPQGVVEGSVLDEKGRAAPFTNVQLLKWTVVEGHGQYQAATGVQTDETGAFRIFGLPAGRYYAMVAGHVIAGHRRAYPPAFYPHAVDVQSAQPIELKPGQEQAILIRLPEPLPAREIRGQVLGASQDLNFQLRPEPASNYSWSLDFSLFVDPKTQAFKISGITEGVYTLEATTQVDGSHRRASTVVTVSDADVSGIRLECATQAELTGTVRADAPQTQAHPFIALRSAHSQFGAPVDGDGNFKFNVVPADTYRLTVQAAGTAYVRSARQGGRDVLRDGLVIADTPPEPLDIVLSSHGATIEGSVAFAESNQPPGAAVALLRQAGGELVLEKQIFVHGSNRFTIEGIAPGDYVLYAWPADAQVEYANPAFMRQYESFSKAVTLIEDARVTVRLDRLVP